MTDQSRELSRSFLAVLLLALAIGGTLWLIRPFFLPGVWAVMLVVATWPLLLKLQRLFKGRRGPAVAVMTTALLLVLVVPLAAGVGALIANVDGLTTWVGSLATWQLPPAPGFIAKIPLAGEKLAAAWSAAEAGGPGYLTSRLSPYLADAAHFFISSAGSVGRMTLEFLVTVIIAAILYSNGESAAKGLTLFANRLMGPRGNEIVTLSGQAIRGVALGVVVTAIVQAVAAGVGLAVVGVPYAMALTALSFVLCVAQLGPVLVMAPAVAWLYWDKGSVWGTGFLIWTIFVGMINNFLQPMLIKRGADLPMLLVFSGVMGGLLSFGVVGIFVGPVLLAVVWTLLVHWVEGEPAV